MKSRVRIVNAPSGTSCFTSKTGAERYVRQGRAVMVKGCLRFLETSEIHNVVRKRSDPYVERGMATVEQVQALPVAGDARKAFSSGGVRIAMRLGRNGPVRKVFLATLSGGRTCEEVVTEVAQ